ncbi:MAG: retroviral-like aspartic protease family protein [candidate division KSB1 bacterium]|nr:retroviral-like aspartic protease family protein [candidate division KSB1 bacterium]MDZ7302515.1 retroviral-like aspartic protease family protein [candidate division KSB1 bacterium]MDZ7311890.1 retroviral-like aspartic protease family protein [candidate division KSB1 bacterium]
MYKANRIAGYFDYGGVLLVPVSLNGLRLYFMVDSGSAYCAINQKLLDKIVAEPTTEMRSVAPLGKEVIKTPTLLIENFVVGGLREKDFVVSIVDFPAGFQIDGLLGMDFMGKYRITIETDSQTLILREIPKKK